MGQKPLASNSRSSETHRIKLSEWQRKFILDGFDDFLRIACTGISAGKSMALALWLVMQMARKPGCRCIAIAQTHKALKRVLIRELKVVCALLGIAYKYNKTEQEFSIGESVVFGYSGENPEAILGLSEIDILVIDEAAYICEEAYQYASDRMRGGKYPTMVRLISSPQSMSAENWFSDIVLKNPDCVVKASALDNPFTSEKFKQGLKDRYGEGSNLYRQQVLGEIFDFDVASQIVMRKDFVQDRLQAEKPGYWMGADFAGGVGADSDVFLISDSAGYVEDVWDAYLNTQAKVGAMSILHTKYNPSGFFGDCTGGYGNGAIDLAKTKGITIDGVNFAREAYNPELYPNARTEMYIELAQDIRNGYYVPPEIQKELLAIQATVDKRGRISLVPKELTKKILGHSPDRADALALSNYARRHCGVVMGGDITAEKAAEIANRYLSMLS